MTREQAQREAAARIELLRYGDEGKDYFWITDMHPTMVMHPYLPELDGQDLTNYEDQRGKTLFVAFVEAVRENGSGFVDYYWQWKDDPDRIVPKLSYVEEFEPWQWVIGTGIYIEDVNAAIARVPALLDLHLPGHRRRHCPAPSLRSPAEPQDREAQSHRRTGAQRVEREVPGARGGGHRGHHHDSRRQVRLRQQATARHAGIRSRTSSPT